MQNCKPINIFVAKCESLSHEMEPKASEERDRITLIPYFSIVGSLIMQ